MRNNFTGCSRSRLLLRQASCGCPFLRKNHVENSRVLAFGRRYGERSDTLLEISPDLGFVLIDPVVDDIQITIRHLQDSHHVGEPIPTCLKLVRR